MADILNLIKGNLRQINMGKLVDLCCKKNVWDHFKMSKKDFFDLSDSNQRQLTSKFYFDNVDNQPSIDESISNIIENSDGVNQTKIFDNGNNRTEMSISTEKKAERKKAKIYQQVEKRWFFSRRLREIQARKDQFARKYPFLRQSGVSVLQRFEKVLL